MLVELAVRDLGVIDELSLVFEPGMTALTGETGAGKTLIVGAIDLLLGGRSDGGMVRAGAPQATVDARFVTGEDETVLRRVIPTEGRSRAYVDGSLATAATLADLGRHLVDIHGQHAQQSLLRPAAQRAALDQFADVDLSPLVEARRELAALRTQLGELGGDERARAREIELLRYQLDELVAADLSSPAEDDELLAEERTLADATAVRTDGAAAADAGAAARDAAAQAAAVSEPHELFGSLAERLRDCVGELDDLTAELRRTADRVEEDPERLAAVQERRRLLTDLRRKYGETVADVIAYRDDVERRLAELLSHDERAAELEAGVARAESSADAAAAAIGARRRAAAPGLAVAVADHFADLAMPNADLAIAVGEDEPGDDVQFEVATSSGSSLRPLGKVASGGELARVMLALRLVLTAGPPVLVFDEVDAGIGGAAALHVGRALAEVAADHQVLVVTHLPQVAAHAHHQVRIAKHDDGRTTSVSAETLDENARVVELSRMLSGQPDSDAAHQHARELIQRARADARYGESP